MAGSRLLTIRRTEVDLLSFYAILAQDNSALFCAYTNTSITVAKQIAQLPAIVVTNLAAQTENMRTLFKVRSDWHESIDKASPLASMDERTHPTLKNILITQMSLLFSIRELAIESPALAMGLTGLSSTQLKLLVNTPVDQLMRFNCECPVFNHPFRTERIVKEFFSNARNIKSVEFALDIVAV